MHDDISVSFVSLQFRVVWLPRHKKRQTKRVGIPSGKSPGKRINTSPQTTLPKITTQAVVSGTCTVFTGE